MTVPSAFVRDLSCPPSDVSGVLADAITVAVGHPAGPTARSMMICTLLGEIYDSVAWVQGSDAGPEELASLAQVVVAAHAHHRRMTAPDPRPGTGS